jgi:hypothetical protein
MLERQKYRQRILNAVRENEIKPKVLSMIMDCMDQNHCETPYLGKLWSLWVSNCLFYPSVNRKPEQFYQAFKANNSRGERAWLWSHNLSDMWDGDKTL